VHSPPTGHADGISARPASLTDPLAQDLGASGFALASAKEVRSRIGVPVGATSWKVFADSWDELAPDAYMQDGGHYRLRTFGAYGAGPSGIFAKGRQPHFQSRTFNGLNGGIDRWFAPIAGSVARGRILMAVMTMRRRSSSVARIAAPGMSKFISFESKPRNCSPGVRPLKACTAMVWTLASL
jgi:hypothetical protein